jgi:formylglycine-generating enzyme required for sulfatase activity
MREAPPEQPPAAAPAVDPGLILAPPGQTTFAFETASLAPDGKLTNRRQATGQYYVADLGGGVTMDMVRIPGGSYDRGSPDTEAGRYPDESPVATVAIRDFFHGRTEVTQAQWRAVAALPKVRVDLPADPSEFKGDDLPVENVTWEQAAEFCDRVSARTHRFYRLPSESEWEYACRAGTTTPYPFGETITPEIANYDGQVAYGAGPKGEGRKKTTPVGSLKLANPFGLYDMNGNVWEWCFGQYHDTWAGAPSDGSSWLEGGDNRLRSIRGGAWFSLAVDCRSANRSGVDMYDSPHGIGLRVLMRPGSPDPWAVRSRER